MSNWRDLYEVTGTIATREAGAFPMLRILSQAYRKVREGFIPRGSV